MSVSPDATPSWAYDEDHYCICCGNGEWKHHMPDCELRDALDAHRIVRALASLSPGVRVDSEYDEWACGMCDGGRITFDEGAFEILPDVPHQDSCPWLVAHRWVEHSLSLAEEEIVRRIGTPTNG